MGEVATLVGLIAMIGLLFLAAAKLKDELCRIRDEWRIRKFIRENGIDKRKLKGVQ